MAFNLVKTLSGNIVIIGITTCLFSDFAFACASLICDNGIETNICAVGMNENDAEWYFNYSLLVFIISLALNLLSKNKNYFFLIISICGVFVAPLFRLVQGGGSCNFNATELAKWMFCASVISLCFQICSNAILSLKKREVFD